MLTIGIGKTHRRGSLLDPSNRGSNHAKLIAIHCRLD